MPRTTWPGRVSAVVSTPAARIRGSFGDVVGQRAPGFDELVELQVDGTKVRSDNVPVGLLADQREVDQVDEHRLQFGGGLRAVGCERDVELRWHEGLPVFVIC